MDNTFINQREIVRRKVRNRAKQTERRKIEATLIM